MRDFSFPVRVYYEDTDAGGVVYYANYLKFLERARTEWLRALGLSQDELARDFGVVFAVRSIKVDYLKPARLDDLLAVSVRVSRRGSASFTFHQAVARGGSVLCEGEAKVACLDAEAFTPRGIPDVLVSKLQTVIS